jgi:lipoic acid synthetase
MKPQWLDKKISLRDCAQLKALLKERGVNTVCEEAMCPNIAECFAKRQATFMILGAVCTRACGFCAVEKGIPLPVDEAEPLRIAGCVVDLGLRHAVITSVTRDDLCDGGAGVFVETIQAIRNVSKDTAVEVLIPDFKADINSLTLLAQVNPDIIAHNVETVPRLYQNVRKGASYVRSLEVFSILKKTAPKIPLKSGIMLGLGEREEELCAVFNDLAQAGCSYLSIGQYLAPSRAHLPVEEYISPEKFDAYKQKALNAGLRYVKSAPYVRSSYMAAQYR